MKNGVLAGFPLVDIKATVVDGSYHDVDSTEMAFKIAGSMALKAAKDKCKPVLLEPIMKVEVTVPEEYMGDVMGDVELPSWTNRRYGYRVQVRKSFVLRCLWLRCSVILQHFVPVHKDAVYSRWSFRTMKKYLRSIAEEIIAKNKGE